jgi:hypothetical protein
MRTPPSDGKFVGLTFQRWMEKWPEPRDRIVAPATLARLSSVRDQRKREDRYRAGTPGEYAERFGGRRVPHRRPLKSQRAWRHQWRPHARSRPCRSPCPMTNIPPSWRPQRRSIRFNGAPSCKLSRRSWRSIQSLGRASCTVARRSCRGPSASRRTARRRTNRDT